MKLESRNSWGSWLLSGIALMCVLAACAVPQPVASQQTLRAEQRGYALEVLVDGALARTFDYGSETYVLGESGQRYVLRVRNRTPRRIEAVVTVDGLDVIDGKSGDPHKRGYLVDAYSYVDIDGWRLSNREAAAFRFAAIADSYAAKTGRARNVGVIGVAVFPERMAAPRPVAIPERRQYEDHSAADKAARGDLADGSERKARSSAEFEAQPSAAAPSAGSLGGSANDAASARAPRAEAPRKRAGLGTEFGEAVSSEIRQVSFVRASDTRPSVLLGARYNDRAGLLALGIDLDGASELDDLALRQSADPFPAQHRFAQPPADWRRSSGL
jgi:hypothetical protein